MSADIFCCVFPGNIHIIYHTQIYLDPSIYIYIYIRACVYVCVCSIESTLIYIYIYMCVCVCVYICGGCTC